jgi:integrase
LASIRQHHGKYQVRYWEPGGRQRAKSFVRKSDARAFAACMEADLARGEYFDPSASRQTLASWVDDFRKTRALKRPGTQEREESTLKAYILPAFGSWALGAVQRIDIQEWVDRLVVKGLAPSTVRRHYGVLHILFEEAVNSDKIVRNPCRKIQLPDATPNEQRFMDAAEVEQLYGIFDPRYRTMVLVGCYAGLRIGEMAALREDRILFLRRQIDVVEGLFEPQSGPVVIGPLKTKHSRGRVDIPQFLVADLARHLELYPPGKPGLVFTNPDGGPLRPRNWRRRQWDPAVAEAALALPCTPHAMRHTFVSFLIDQGVPVEKVCEQARHRDPSFTWRVYRHRFPKQTEAVSEALERVRGAVSHQSSPGRSDSVSRIHPST